MSSRKTQKKKMFVSAAWALNAKHRKVRAIKWCGVERDKSGVKKLATQTQATC